LVEAEADEQAVAASLVIVHKLSVERLQDLEAATKEEEDNLDDFEHELDREEGPSRFLASDFPIPDAKQQPEKVEKRVSTFLAEVASICSLSRSPSIESLRSEASAQPYVLAGKWTDTARLQSQSAHWEQILQLSDSRPEATRHRRPTRLSEVIEEVKAKTVLDRRPTQFRKDPPSRTAIRTSREIMQSHQQRLSQQEKNQPPKSTSRTVTTDAVARFEYRIPSDFIRALE